jgi:preprotein translocase subunit YajC
MTKPIFPALLAQDAPAANPSGGMTQTLLMIGIALVFFYFILWRPEQKRRKAAEQMRASLKKGDRVTAMGIVGRVDGAKIEVLKAAITDVQAGTDAEMTIEP